MLAFDNRGYRLGYGKGYYDKFFEKNRDLTYLGYGYDFQEVSSLPVESFDIKLDAIITNKSINIMKL